MRKGFSLVGVLTLSLFLFVLFLGLHGALEMSRKRLSTEKQRETARWLSVSGADYAQARVAQGRLKPGQTLSSPQYQQGRFEVEVRGSMIVSTGICGTQSFTTERRVGAR